MRWPFGKKSKTMIGGSDALIQQRDPVLDVLHSKGDNGQTPRHSIFYFYGGDLSGLSEAAAKAGYSVSSTVNDDGVILEKTQPVDEASFEIIEAAMSAWAEKFGSEYDGWECALVTN